MAFVIMRPTLEDDNFSPAQMADQGMADMAGNASVRNANLLPFPDLSFTQAALVLYLTCVAV